MAAALGVPAGVPVDLGAYQPASTPLASQPGQEYPEKVALYPNPAAEQLTVHFAAGKSAWVGVEVLTLLAQRVLWQEFPLSAGATTLTLNLKPLPPGVYLVRMARGAESSVQRVVVAR